MCPSTCRWVMCSDKSQFAWTCLQSPIQAMQKYFWQYKTIYYRAKILWQYKQLKIDLFFVPKKFTSDTFISQDYLFTGSFANSKPFTTNILWGISKLLLIRYFPQSFNPELFLVQGFRSALCASDCRVKNGKNEKENKLTSCKKKKPEWR